MQRLNELGCLPPDLTLSYRALESIFGAVFDRAEPQLHMRWILLKNRLGLPHVVTMNTFREVSEFADTELSALVLMGGSSLNPGLPMTDNQKARQQQLKEGEKKRAAAAQAAATAAAKAATQTTPPATSQQPTAARLSSPLSSWAPLCTHWKAGKCSRGVSCHFHHDGFPVEEKRCFICKDTTHSSKDCTCHGGGADPDKEKHWEEYRARRKAAEEAGKIGKGAKEKGKGKGNGGKSKGTGNKGKDKGKDKGGKGPEAKACIDQAMAAAATEQSGKFPRDCVALDTWANVWMKHQKDKPPEYFQDTLHLAYGECWAHKETSAKGVPTVYVPWSPDQDNIDLFPQGFLWERGCTITQGDDSVVITPKGREFQILSWGSMPYIRKDVLQQILVDLPDCQEKGRSGRPAQAPTAARASLTNAPVNLEHLREWISGKEITKIRVKYRNLPDLYYENKTEKLITPERFDGLNNKVVQQASVSKPPKFWELCSGSGALSTRGRQRRIPHLPPVDLRYGWFTQRRADQIIILHALLHIGVNFVFAAPNCSLWGQCSHSVPRDLLEARRAKEAPGLVFLSLVCLVQVLLGRHFLIENSGASVIFEASPLKIIKKLFRHASRLHQCMYGAILEDQPIKKHTVLVSDAPITGLNTTCDHSHRHLLLQGSGPGGGRPASAARYPTKLCDAILDNMSATPQDGGRYSLYSSLSFSLPQPGTKEQQVIHSLQQLREVASKEGYEDLFTQVVDPWIQGRTEQTLIKAATTSTNPNPDTSSAVAATLEEPLAAPEAAPEAATLEGPLAAPVRQAAPQPAPEQQEVYDRMLQPFDPDSDEQPEADPPPTQQQQQEENPPREKNPPREENPPGELEGLFTGNLPQEPWQNKRYNSDDRIWQAAAMRKRQHARRTNTSLGVCTVDLSGPHEPSPRPGCQLHRDPVTYFLVLTLRPDMTRVKVDTATQTGDVDQPPSQPQPDLPDRPLIYAALLGSKSAPEVAEAIKELLAQIRDEHAGLPQELFFRIHSDRGGEFIGEELVQYCKDHAIHKTTTQGHDPNANASAELGVGTLKRRCRHLLIGSRLPTKFWGVGILAAAELERADIGVGQYPRIPFGTRGMLVTSPPPRNAWAPRAEPCTIFGGCSNIPHAQYVYQKGWIKPRSDLQPEGLSQDELAWVKLSSANWDAPDRPLELPPAADFDAAAMVDAPPENLPAATCQTTTCEACLQTKFGRRQTRRHSLRWGECIKAPRPMPNVAVEEDRNFLQEIPFEQIDPENRLEEVDEEHIAGEIIDDQHASVVQVAAAHCQSTSSARGVVGNNSNSRSVNCSHTHTHYDPQPLSLRDPAPIEQCPHAALAMAKASSDQATWGSSSSDWESTEAPGDEDEIDYLDVQSQFSDDDEWIVNPGSDVEPPAADEALADEDHEEDNEDNEPPARSQRHRRRHRRRQRRRYDPHFTSRFVRHLLPLWCAMSVMAPASAEKDQHLETVDLELLQQLAGPEPGNTIVPPQEIRKALGADLDAWVLAAQAEHDSFISKEAVITATPEDIRAYGNRPLPMINVWSKTPDDHRKCRSCIAGNFQQFDATAQRWTAQAEPSSIFISAKMAAVRHWTISKLDVKGAFLNAPIPESQIILVNPPGLWVEWGIVPKGTVWKLLRAVYGLRESPKWWADERDVRLKDLRATVRNTTYRLQQNEADTQVWSIVQDDIQNPECLGLICVYVDDFLILAPPGAVRNAVVESLKKLWEFGDERILTPTTSITFLGIDWHLKTNGDIFLTQERFAQELLEKHQMHNCNALQAVSLDRPPEVEDPPTSSELTQLQSFAGAFNWLATRTRPDLSYYTSLLASSASRQSAWSQDLAHKVLRYIRGTANRGLLMSADGEEAELTVYSDAGFAGADTKSQNGLVVFWAGSIITWRSSRAALSALSTAEAELCCAALSWQVAEGLRYFLSTLRVFPRNLILMVDNRAAITAATLGATWRTRYYAVRARRLLEEYQRGKVVVKHCPTQEMLADGLTKLATREVMTTLLNAMENLLPKVQIAHRVSTSPGPANRSDCAGDGPLHIPSCSLPHSVWEFCLRVDETSHPDVAKYTNGTFVVAGEHHCRPYYTKVQCNHNITPIIYYYDDRDGAEYQGWWLSPKLEGDLAWSFCPTSSSTPPATGWQVPWDGPRTTGISFFRDKTEVKEETCEDESERKPEAAQQQEAQQQQHQHQPDHHTQDDAAPPKKKRRGVTRVRLGSTERRWKLLEAE